MAVESCFRQLNPNLVRDIAVESYVLAVELKYLVLLGFFAPCFAMWVPVPAVVG